MNYKFVQLKSDSNLEFQEEEEFIFKNNIIEYELDIIEETNFSQELEKLVIILEENYNQISFKLLEKFKIYIINNKFNFNFIIFRKIIKFYDLLIENNIYNDFFDNLILELLIKSFSYPKYFPIFPEIFSIFLKILTINQFYINEIYKICFEFLIFPFNIPKNIIIINNSNYINDNINLIHENILHILNFFYISNLIEIEKDIYNYCFYKIINFDEKLLLNCLELIPFFINKLTEKELNLKILIENISFIYRKNNNFIHIIFDIYSKILIFYPNLTNFYKEMGIYDFFIIYSQINENKALEIFNIILTNSNIDYLYEFLPNFFINKLSLPFKISNIILLCLSKVINLIPLSKLQNIITDFTFLQYIIDRFEFYQNDEQIILLNCLNKILNLLEINNQLNLLKNLNKKKFKIYLENFQEEFNLKNLIKKYL